MNINKFRYAFILIVLLNFSTLSYCNNVFHKHGYSIWLPDGWVEIPAGVIESAEHELAKHQLFLPQLHSDCGFQIHKKNNWFEYPYILIRIDNTERLSKNKILKLKKSYMQEAVNQLDIASSLILDSQIEETNYDENSNIMWVQFTSNVLGIGQVSSMSGMIFTEQGYIQITGYSLKNDYISNKQIFQTVINSVVLDNELQYTYKWQDRLDDMRDINWEIIAGKFFVIALIVSLPAIIYRIRKNNYKRRIIKTVNFVKNIRNINGSNSEQTYKYSLIALGLSLLISWYLFLKEMDSLSIEPGDSIGGVWIGSFAYINYNYVDSASILAFVALFFILYKILYVIILERSIYSRILSDIELRYLNIYNFHLPSVNKTQESVYNIACSVIFEVSRDNNLTSDDLIYILQSLKANNKIKPILFPKEINDENLAYYGLLYKFYNDFRARNYKPLASTILAIKNLQSEISLEEINRIAQECQEFPIVGFEANL